ncbi:unnamed protein product [Parnassius mnemosyne]|uniref:Uncharacterized protein n=1 Tax=Parnassius mnemosyne TaxID=213953 RepID=A0AAV1KDX6_9NEOP
MYVCLFLVSLFPFIVFQITTILRKFHFNNVLRQLLFVVTSFTDISRNSRSRKAATSIAIDRTRVDARTVGPIRDLDRVHVHVQGRVVVRTVAPGPEVDVPEVDALEAEAEADVQVLEAEDQNRTTVGLGLENGLDRAAADPEQSPVLRPDIVLPVPKRRASTKAEVMRMVTSWLRHR